VKGKLKDFISNVKHLIKEFICKLKKRTNNTKYYIKESIKWHRQYLYLNWYIPVYSIWRILSIIIKTVFLIISFCEIIIHSEMILFTGQCVPYFNNSFSTNYISQESIMGMQITITLICVSLIALVANIEKKYIYGEQLINIAFSSHGPFSFKWMMIYLFILLLANTFLMLSNVMFVYIVFVFLASVYFAVIILYKFAAVFLNQNSLRRNMSLKYYKSNLTYMKKERPIEPYISVPLDNLKSATIKSITYNEWPEVSENLRLYFKVLVLSLYNKPKAVQEYLTEMTNLQDVIGHISELSQLMLFNGHESYGLRTYNLLLKKLNYYKITGIVNVILSSSIDIFVDAFSTLHNKLQYTEYFNQLLTMVSEYLEQVYLQTIVDFSYCRLAQDNLIHSHAYNHLYEKLYDLVTKSEVLSDDDKNEFLESIRSNIISLYCRKNIRSDIECFQSKSRFPKKDRVFSLEIMGEPIARYLLRLIENNDIKTLRMYDHMGSRNDSWCFAKTLAVLSVLDMVYRKYKRTYMIDIKIKEHDDEALFKKCDLLKLNADKDTINKYYSFILSHYVKCVDKEISEGPGGIYGFNPKFVYNKIVVDTYFAYVIWKMQDGLSIETIAKENGFEYSTEIKDLLQRFE